jgi:serine phosphatase RsbU (regulator of sigma subunit)
MSRQRILRAAAMLLGDQHVTMAEIAAAAEVGRSTLYRHFPTRQALEQALEEMPEPPGSAPAEAQLADSVAPLSYQPPGQLGRRTPLALEVTRILDEVPPHLVPDQLVAEVRRASGVPVALYVVDIDGSQLLRLAGSEEFPRELEAPPALGPEIVPEGLPAFHDRLQRLLPGCTCEPLWLRGRVIALLLCVGDPISPLGDLAKQGAAALELAGDYTDFIEATRRRKPTTPAAEVQQHLFPPRVARIAGGQLAGALLPSYEVGGDWFDFVENRDGAWLAIADTAGTGPTAAGLGASALGALRASRRAGGELSDALTLMDETIRQLDNDKFFMAVWLARWRAATATLTWVNCGRQQAYLISADGTLADLGGPEHEQLGRGPAKRTFTSTSRQLRSGERLVLVTDGITERRMEGGGTFGVDGIRRALDQAGSGTAASLALAIQQAVTDCWREPLEDDGTVVVFAIR